MSPFPWEIAATPGWTMAIHLESLNGPSECVPHVLPSPLIGHDAGSGQLLITTPKVHGDIFPRRYIRNQRVHQVESLTSQGLVMSRVFKPA